MEREREKVKRGGKTCGDPTLGRGGGHPRAHVPQVHASTGW